MAKYGSGTSMKTTLLMEMSEIKEAVKSLPKEEQKVVTDAYKELAYQFCEINAHACYSEDLIKQIMTEEQYDAFIKFYIRSFMPYETQKMFETYPWWDEEAEDEKRTDEA